MINVEIFQKVHKKFYEYDYEYAVVPIPPRISTATAATIASVTSLNGSFCSDGKSFDLGLGGGLDADEFGETSARRRVTHVFKR